MATVLSNAIEAFPPSGEVWVSAVSMTAEACDHDIRLYAAKPHVLVTVAANGPVISDDGMLQIFDVCFSTKKKASQK